MLNISNKKLTVSDNRIKSSDTIINLTSDLDCSYIGVLRFIDGDQKIINFVKTEKDYQARLIITADDVKKLKASKFYVVMISGSLSQQTNTIEFEFDLELIKQSIKAAISNEILDIKKDLVALENKLNSLTKYGTLPGINIQNKELIKKGMIPVAIDDKGNFVAMYPFQDFVSEINGQKAANGSVVIDASMINYNRGKTIEQEMLDHANAIAALNRALVTLSDQVKKISQQAADIEKRLETHITNGII